MKKLIVLLFFISAMSSINIVVAQEYKYFYSDGNSEFQYFFKPKKYSYSPLGLTQDGNWTPGVPLLNKYYYNTLTPIFQEIFGSQYKYNGNDRILARIRCTFYFREDFKPYYFFLFFPTSLIEEFPQWEEKLFRLCEKCMTVDIRPFIELRGEKESFKGSTFDVYLFNLYQYTQGKIRLDN